ncbi:MAG: citramalate synthase [Gammaproteobacteria bacterium]|nr:citramalate synthase [Gammaproteobacteria bacterium]MBU1653931.1 citramalate synthase [Gammaproteobacteria bacterium]MBU1960928.1 citramalate synthase [Gammaproteobacteria bacterium]
MVRPSIFLYDTTLRDGAQREDISLSVEDKLTIAHRLAGFGMHYIECGWPGSNPKDADFYARANRMKLPVKLAAFGRTRRPHSRCEDDTNLGALIDAATPVVTVVGKSWDYHATHVLKTTLEENLAMIGDSMACLKGQGREVIFDAEHFYDGYLANPEYALATLKAAHEAGADWLVLCETNGGRLPWEVEAITREVSARLPGAKLGMHCHNDSGCAVANSLAGVRAGATMIQGTINGYGERVGNADLVTILPNLQLKMGFEVLPAESLGDLTRLSRFVAEVANLKHDDHQPYTGHSAFAHKGGIHVAAILKSPDTYQHIDPELVGNEMRSVTSELSGRGNIVLQARRLGLDLDNEQAQRVLGHIKHLEHEGFTFEAAEASVELMFHRLNPAYARPFELLDYFVITERRHGRGLLAEATVKVKVGDEVKFTAAEGNGPVNALATALQIALVDAYPVLRTLRLTDYKVRILAGTTGTAANTRVLIDFQSGEESWTTVGANTNIIDASWRALSDSMEYALIRLGRQP